MNNPYEGAVAVGRPVIELDADSRATFIARTYLHLFGALLAFTLLEVVLFQTGLVYPIAEAMLSVSWLLVLGAFMVVGWLASRAAHTVESVPLQYLALCGFVVAEALIFAPLLLIAFTQAPGAISSAAAVSLVAFVGLTAVALYRARTSRSCAG